MHRSVIIAVSAATLLSACAADGTVNENVAGGAAVGAILGAVTGAIIGDRTGAIVGAGVGAVAGGAVGAYLDEQQKELERNLEGTGATVVNTGEELLVNLPNEVTFDVDQAAIKPEFRDPLSEVAETLVKFESSAVDIIGHTDSTGSDAYNQTLSERRADSVSDFLTRRGVIRERIVAFGEGETQPIADNGTAEGRARNRRVEIKITPITAES
ncbi:MAG: OmpA family protein [Pseudomonadota bacterium]